MPSPRGRRFVRLWRSVGILPGTESTRLSRSIPGDRGPEMVERQRQGVTRRNGGTASHLQSSSLSRLLLGGRWDGRRAGFTLLEVVVALAVTGVVILGARAVLAQLGDDAARMTATAAADDREANAGQLVRDLLGRAEAPGQGGPRFVGDARAVRFDTRCDVPAGWQERCQAEIGVVEVNGVPTVGLTLSTGEAVVLRRGFGRAVLRYLYDPGNGGTWVGSWSSAFSLPWAVGIEVDGETVILPIGERG